MSRHTKRTTRRARQPQLEGLEGRLVLSGGFDQFPIPGPPPEMIVQEAPAIVAGPDGGLWFAGDQGDVGRVTTDGVVTLIPVPAGSGPLGGVTVGADGRVWFTRGDVIGSVDLDGNVTTIPLPPGQTAAAITADDDGNLWFVEHGGYVGRYATDGSFTQFAPPHPGEFFIAQQSITAGPDGNIWFTRVDFREGFVALIDRITPDGTVTEFPVSASYEIALGLVSGPDGNLWFTRSESQSVGSMTTDGQITAYAVPGRPRGITTGPDGDLWFTLTAGLGSPDAIGRITLDGEVSSYTVPAGDAPLGHPLAIALGPDGNLWFTQIFGHAIGRLDPTAVTPGGRVSDPPPPDPTDPLEVPVVLAFETSSRPPTVRHSAARLTDRVTNAPVSVFYRHTVPSLTAHAAPARTKARPARQHAALHAGVHRPTRLPLRQHLRAILGRHRRGH